MYTRYPKLTLLLVFYIAALFLSPVLGVITQSATEELGAIVAFILGFLYSFSFAGGFAALILFSYDSFSFWYICVAACGAMTADFVLMRFIQLELTDEFTRLFQERPFRTVLHRLSFLSPAPVRVALAIFCIGSPLPDELGILLLAQVRELQPRTMLILSFAANFTGMYIIARIL